MANVLALCKISIGHKKLLCLNILIYSNKIALSYQSNNLQNAIPFIWMLYIHLERKIDIK